MVLASQTLYVQHDGKQNRQRQQYDEGYTLGPSLTLQLGIALFVGFGLSSAADAALQGLYLKEVARVEHAVFLGFRLAVVCQCFLVVTLPLLQSGLYAVYLGQIFSGLYAVGCFLCQIELLSCAVGHSCSYVCVCQGQSGL